MTKPKLLIGGVDLSTRLKAFDASPSGPGVIGSATLSLEAAGGGGISILNRMDVKLWLPFNVLGAGIADRGRIFGGLVEDRAEGTIGTTKTWDLTLSDWNLLGDTIVRDAAGTHVITLTADTFAAQMAAVVQVVQENGFGVVASQIDATTGVADLHATMPAQVLPPGKKLGWYIQALCLKAQELNAALRPQWFIGWGNTFGAVDTFGGPVLWVYDGALTPAPAFAFSDAPTGSEKKMFNATTRGLESTEMVQRRQSIFNTGAIATYSDTSAQTTYPNPYINHNRPTNTGYWGLEPVEDRESRTFAEAEAKLRGHVLSHSTPRETIEFETPERVKPGEVVTITWPLYSLSAASKRVAGVGTHLEPPDTLWSRVILNRRRSGLFAGEEGIEAPPEEGLPPRPLAVTDLALPINVYDAARQEAHLVLTFTPSPSNTVARHIAVGTIGGMPIYESTADPTTNEIHAYGPGASSYDITVVAEDHWGQKSEEFTPHETGTSAPPPAWENVRNPSFEELDAVDAPLEPPRHWSLFGVVGGGASGTSTAQHLGGARSLLLRTSAVTDVVKMRSDTVVAQPNVEYSIAVPRRGSVASDALYIAVEWMEGDVIHSTVALGTDIPVATTWETGFPAYYPITSPNVATIDGRRLVLGVVTPSVAGDVFVDDVEFVPQLGGRHIEDGAITVSHLDLLAETNPIEFKDDGGTVRGELYASNSLVTLDATGSVQVRLQGGGLAQVLVGTDAELDAPSGTLFLSAEDVRVSGDVTGTDTLTVTGPSGLTANLVKGVVNVTDKFRITAAGEYQTWDGTRWLGPLVLWSLADSFSGGTALTYTGTTLIGRWAAPSRHTWWIVGITWSFRVATTNNATNFWTLRMGTENAGGGGTVQSDLNTYTGTESPDINYARDDLTFTNNPMDFASSDYFDIFLEVRKDTGAPGTLNLYGANLILRRVF